MKYIYKILICFLLTSQISFAQCWEKISAGQLHTLAIRTDGTLYSWGYNNFWQLGLGNNTSVSLPTQIGSDTTWQSISAGKDYSMAIKRNGTLWAWGFNTSGKLGVGGTSLRSTPTQVGTDSNWAKVNASEGNFTAAIKKDGTLWTWGANVNGELGNTLTNGMMVTMPAQIGTDTTWADLSLGINHAVALKKNGTLWAWGVGGILGDTTNFNKYAPAQIGNALNWKYITAGKRHTLAIKTNGTLWVWGDNQAGQLGIGSLLDKKLPTIVGTATNWQSVSAWENTSIGVRTNGTMYSWGSNTYGQLGDSTTIDKNAPIQIGTATDWKELSIGQSHASVIKNNNFRAAWGNNSVGQLGDNTLVDKLAPFVIVCLAPLPIHLISFTGVKLSETNKLDWVISNAEDLQYFEIERSDDGVFFNTIGMVQKSGAAGDIVSYTFTDETPLKSINYYRLKQIEVNGNFDYSNVINLNNGVTTELYIYPNPIKNYLNIQGLTDPINATEYSITDVYGKLIIRGSVLPNQSISLLNLNAGLYYLQVGGSILKFTK